MTYQIARALVELAGFAILCGVLFHYKGPKW